MPSVATANAQGTKNKSSALRKMVELHQVEVQAKSSYLHFNAKVGEQAVNESWAELASVAKEGRGNALITLARLKGMSKAALQMPYEVAELRSLLQNHSFRQNLEGFMTVIGKDISVIDKNIDKTTNNEIIKTLNLLTNYTLCKRGSFAIASGFTGYWAGFFAEFNLECQKSNLIRLDVDSINAIADFLSRQNKALMLLLLQTKETLEKGGPDDIYKHSISILFELEEQLFWLPSYAAKIYLTLKKAKQMEIISLIDVLAKLDLNIGILVRNWALVTAIALYTAHIGILHEDAKEFKELKKNSEKLPVKSKIPYGEAVTIQELLEKGWHYNSKLVCVSGFVSDIKISRAGNLYRTEFTLSDITDSYCVQALAVYENLPHHGLIGDSYVKLNGLWEMTSKIADHPIIKIDRVTLSKYKKESWLDYMTSAVRPWFDYFPGSHNLSWSVRPEIKEGERAKVSNKTGAGELEFKKAYIYKGGK